MKKIFEQGREAAERGQERCSPYHDNKRQLFWYAGFANLDYEEFKAAYKESCRQIKSSLGYARVGLNNV